ncbi:MULTISPECIES: hypothetical protein [Pseudonocardia]|uniref:Uncharacterized protein n=2 Tax=Pseudonocardia TaxID=1847 RepID=A0A1Y2MSC8_PSEAH|nr:MULTISPECIES: hypothetical protein [Pseudonocardia]OSY37428.1 hypothetical protein BG845_04731 [Pseudonocardia autotrophica]TDN77247.1 hypothetical protein C8E95_6483 [Pseudonocardia autotrophica]BBG01266.1 hypothetical protein Pdca_24750 [Pseudonocardia autotrophica]GEC25993.1 hypothetical protein PSA01_30220 [Pseudonocardia saturnea]
MTAVASLRREYLRLGAGELAAAFVFAVVAVPAAARLGTGPALWAALAGLLAILLHAGVYWLLARQRIPGGRMGPREAAGHRAARAGSALLLAAGLGGLLAWWPPSPGAALLCLGVWLFGVAEYVNYHLVRLAYAPHRWLHGIRRRSVPRLCRDLSRVRS